VTVPVVVHAKLALAEVVLVPGALVIVTVGGAPTAGGEATVQLYVAELLPYALETVTLNVCGDTARPL
jgi:hypothetical protein